MKTVSTDNFFRQYQMQKGEVTGPLSSPMRRPLLISIFCHAKSVSSLASDYRDISAVIDSNATLCSTAYISALIAAEDHRYLSHLGIDWISILRATYQTICRRRLQGASTIEQQLVRVTTKRYEISISRKVRELILAAAIGRSYKKIQLAKAYLGVAFFGTEMIGLEQACLKLDINPLDTNFENALAVVARLKRPQPTVITPKWSAMLNARIEHIRTKTVRYRLGLSETEAIDLQHPLISEH